MPTYLYCLRSDAADPSAGLTGVDGAVVRAVRASGLIAWVSDVADGITPTVDRVKAHDAVCAAALCAGETPLPVRFGQTFPDDASAMSDLAARESVLQPRLARIAGCVELRLVMPGGLGQTSEESIDEPGTAAASADTDTSLLADGPGTAFLKQLAHRRRSDVARAGRCEEVRQAVRSATRSLIAGQQPCETARGVSFFAVLVRRADVDAFRAAVSEILRIKAIPLSVLGPFAPYSFAGDA